MLSNPCKSVTVRCDEEMRVMTAWRRTPRVFTSPSTANTSPSFSLLRCALRLFTRCRSLARWLVFPLLMEVYLSGYTVLHYQIQFSFLDIKVKPHYWTVNYTRILANGKFSGSLPKGEMEWYRNFTHTAIRGYEDHGKDPAWQTPNTACTQQCVWCVYEPVIKTA